MLSPIKKTYITRVYQHCTISSYHYLDELWLDISPGYSISPSPKNIKKTVMSKKRALLKTTVFIHLKIPVWNPPGDSTCTLQVGVFQTFCSGGGVKNLMATFFNPQKIIKDLRYPDCLYQWYTCGWFVEKGQKAMFKDILPRSCSTMCFTPKDTKTPGCDLWRHLYVTMHCYVQT